MQIKSFAVGQLQTNCYVVTDEKNHLAAVIDPGAESGRILNYLEDNHLKTEAVQNHQFFSAQLSSQSNSHIHT